MKNSIYSLFFVAALLASCASEEVANASLSSSNGDESVFTATIEGDVTSRSTLGSTKDTSGKYPVYWSSGDIMAINGILYQTTSTGTTSGTFRPLWGDAGDAVSGSSYTAVYPSSLANVSGSNVTYSIPATYNIDYTDGRFDMPMCAISTTTTLQFHNLCGALAIDVASSLMTKVSYIKVTAGTRMNGAFTPSSDGTLNWVTSTASTDAEKTLTVHYTTAVDISSGSKTLYVPIPAGTYSNLKVMLYGDGKVCMVPMPAAGITVTRSNIVKFTDPIQKCALVDGDFSVAAGKTVKFTLGNLYWNGGSWKLEDRQTDCWNHTEWNTSHADLLSWVSVQDYYSGNAAYMPYNMSYSSSTMSASDKSWLYEDNAITVDGVSGLYLLSIDEWRYLFETRTNASSLYKHSVTVGSTMYCTIIAPDGYDYKTTPLRPSYSSLDELNMYGILCLPPAGASDNFTYKQYIGQNCRYNACYSSSTLSSNDYYQYWNQNGSGHVFQTAPRSYRYACRLVR